MKADVSIPQPVYEATDQLAERLGLSLSELYTAALTAYLSSHQGGAVTEALDRVYQSETSTIDPVLLNIQLASLGEESW